MSNFILGCVPSPEDKRDFISTAVIPGDVTVPRKLFWDTPCNS